MGRASRPYVTERARARTSGVWGGRGVRLTRALLSAGVYAYGHVNATLSSLSLGLMCYSRNGGRTGMQSKAKILVTGL